MATIGLYDVDFNHGGTFNLSVPLMKVYERLVSSHQVVLMKPYEKQEDTIRFITLKIAHNYQFQKAW